MNDATRPAGSSIGGVIVTYFPDVDFGARLSAIAREVGPLIVVDNSAAPEVHARLRLLAAAVGAEFVASATNVGLGAALNLAFHQLANQGAAWAVAFDQDSTPAPGFSGALRATARDDAMVAVVGANWSDDARPDAPSRHLRAAGSWRFERIPANSDLAEVTCVITSGSLLNLRVWRELGGFDEALFLDLVDTDYCLRAKAAGYDIRVAADARLQHRRGNKRPIVRFGRTWWPAFMPPPRLRLLFRNRLRLFRRHAVRAPHWVAFELIYATKIVAEVIFLEDRKAAKIAACVRGVWDGLLGRGGAT
jgi:rhamnosyltransferase